MFSFLGVWSKPLLYGEKYDLDTNEDCEWVVGVLPEVKQFIESGSDADVIRDQFKLELCGSLTNPEKKQKCLDLSDKYYKRVSNSSYYEAEKFQSKSSGSNLGYLNTPIEVKH